MPATSLDSWQILTYSKQAFLFRTPPERFSYADPHFVRAGLPFLRNVAGFLKPTTCFVQRFGHLANRSVLDLSLHEIKQLVQRGELNIESRQEIEAPGYVMIRIFGNSLGCSLLMDDNRLLCRFPKALKQIFRND